jgi:YHS domain-containing protein
MAASMAPRGYFMKRNLLSAISFCFAILFCAGALAQDGVRLVLKGYDPVAYFTDGKPVAGNPKISYDWDEGRYYFASAQHRDMFAGDPEKYAPQFGGYCTGSMSRGVRNDADPEGWIIVDGKLYVFGAAKFREIALNDPNYLPSRLENAKKNYTAGRK